MGSTISIQDVNDLCWPKEVFEERSLDCEMWVPTCLTEGHVIPKSVPVDGHLMGFFNEVLCFGPPWCGTVLANTMWGKNIHRQC